MAKNNQVSVTELTDTSFDRLWARETSKVLVLVPPYVVGLLFVGMAAAFHQLWGRGPAAPWATVGTTLVTVILSAVGFGVSHHRGGWGQIHTTVTVFLTGMWITAATITGVAQPVVAYLAIVGGLGVAISWNLRAVIRRRDPEAGRIDGLGWLFDRTKASFGLEGATAHTTEATDRKIEAKLELPPGEKTVADVQKRKEYIEGGMGLPPGAVTIAADTDRADHAHMTVSDPRVMKNPIPWPGPSRPGASVAEPLRLGVWQDADDTEYTIVGHHVQVMGMSGSGKSIGCCWNTLAEIVSRRDSMVLAIDLKKGEQTLGPMRPALHRFERTPEGAKDLISELRAKLAERTDALAAKGLVKWQEGCGLSYIVLWIEEAWRLFEVVDMDEFEDLMKALRSAGGTVVYSLQRGDSTQVPTLVKGQVATWCFGVANSHDAGWGLSDAQDEGGAKPELWQTHQPGMCYLDAPSIPRDRVAMPWRTYNWAEDMAAIRAHAEQFPVADRPADAISASLVRDTTVIPPEDTSEPAAPRSVAEEYLSTDDPDPELQAGPDDPIEDQPDDRDLPFQRGPGKKLPADEAYRTILDQLAEWIDEGRERFATKDLAATWTRTGWSRSWVIKQLGELKAKGVIEDDDGGGYRLLRAPERTP